jgi:ADP-heptose:LPS heptosyltransferase
MSRYKNILVIRLSAMGDVAMTVPVIVSVADQHPDTAISILSNNRFRDMFPVRDNITFAGININDYKGLQGLWKLYKELTANNRFDAVIDLHDVMRSKILRTFFRIKGIPVYKIDKGRKEKKDLVSHSKKKLVPLQNTINRYLDVFEKAGLPAPFSFSGLFGTTPSLPQQEEELKEKKGRWIAIAPFAQHKGKILPLEKTEAVIEYFSQQPDTKILLFGGGKYEKEILEGWQQKYPDVISLAGKYPLRDELHLLQNSDVLLSMDSANMHLASLVNTPVVSIWGATHPFSGFSGYNPNPDNFVQIDLDCRPCSIYGNKPCKRGDYACLTKINPSVIISKIENILASQQQ